MIHIYNKNIFFSRYLPQWILLLLLSNQVGCIPGNSSIPYRSVSAEAGGVASGGSCSLSAGAGTENSSAQILTGYYGWTSTGSSVNGTMSNLGTINLSTTSPSAAGYYASFSNGNPTNTTICTGTQILGVNGSALCTTGTPTGTTITASALCSGYGGYNQAGTAINGSRHCSPPQSISGLKVYYAAQYLNGVAGTNPADSATIATWTDLTTNATNAVQATESLKPIFRTNEINSYPTVYFDGVDDHLLFTRVIEDDFTIAVVFKSDQGTSTGTNFFQGSGIVSGEVGGVVNDFSLGLNANGRLLAGIGGDYHLYSNTGFNDDNAHIVVFTRHRYGGIALYVDGTQSMTLQNVSTNALTTPTNIAIGMNLDSSTFLRGGIAEIAIFETGISNKDRQLLECTWSTKFGIAITHGC